ncbi:nitrate reductase subunit alpha [Phaeovibrio sulfidiphilus]|uniref:nitrate reductase (quinone) n=1 Tax=Phaeovibrio sulfidiphilus TaxID=1220600 RepID=A0A8J7CWE3_9PROT|nr:nitrate reductase subunit alpha [Phaeovibrio sulfidiphilus]MBE1237381.1 nitrate reductase subunit alpha [Phaeovibrio sulfidiphilus]
MSHILDKLTYFTRKAPEKYSGGHGITTDENRQWEDAYRGRWAHDKIVRSTHGVNCTGSCSWKIYVKGGLVTWETQFTDYPRTRPDLPNHEPRGCPRGASYSWYLYSATRLKYPMIRSRLLRLWRKAREVHTDPVLAWESIVTDPVKTASYKTARGLGGMVRADWDEMNEIIAASNIYTAKTFGPDRVCGFSPIPAMSMISYASGTRYLSLIGGTCLSFYDWYCDLPPSSPQVWGEQTDVPESADWYNSSYIIAWGSNVPQTRTPDAHFFTEVRYKGTRTVAVTPDYSEVAKLSDEWIAPRQGTDAALLMAMGHVILTEYHARNRSEYFDDYCRQYTDMPFLVRLDKKAGGLHVAGRTLRASDIKGALGADNNPEWKPVLWDSVTDSLKIPNGTIGSRWGEKGRWNLEMKDETTGAEIWPTLSLAERHDVIVEVGFPYFGNIPSDQLFDHTNHESILKRRVPARRVLLADGTTALVATVFDLQLANYGVAREVCGDPPLSSDGDEPYTPAWQEKITGVPRETVIRVAREFADNADRTRGRSMVILGAGINHWYHMDMAYRGIINLLMMCGCIGKSGGGWSHYVGQEKLRPQTGWLPLAFGLDWHRPPRQMNSTSFFYAHTDQWRYEKVGVDDILSPLADPKKWEGQTLIDCNVRAERMGWLPSAPQFQENPLRLTAEAEAQGRDPKEYVVSRLKDRSLALSCEDPDNPANFPRVLFVWRSNLLGASGKGHEYFLRHLLGTQNSVMDRDLGEANAPKPSEVVWRDEGPRGKLDLLVTLDFRMSTSCLYSDIVLPTATWYEKNDLNTSDMHPFIHPLSRAVDPAWESRSDWDIYREIARRFSEMCPGHLGLEKDLVAQPILHDSPGELAQPFGPEDWKKGEAEPVPGRTLPNLTVVERNYPDTHRKYTSLGPLMKTIGNGGKGIAWNTDAEVDFLGRLNGVCADEGVSCGLPKIETDIDATEVVLSLAPETNGQVALKAWEALGVFTGRDHTHLARPREDEKLRFRDLQAQPRKIISSPTWSGLEDEHVSYNAGYTNVHELIPWRTLTGRQHFYQDHDWMRDFGEGFCVYRPPVNTRTVASVIDTLGKDRKQVVLNWVTPHQKWGIHSTYSENLLMLTLSRGGPIVWMSETDARKAGIRDNDWIECYNANGAVVARAVVSQRVPEGLAMMYHAQEKIMNTPISETTGKRGGIHNSVVRIILKPTHMIGGYAQLAYGFNYYGTVGSNRDDFVVVRKMDTVEWQDEPALVATVEETP